MTEEMKMLLWKDYRLSRLCLSAGVIIMILPYLMLFLPYIFHKFEFNYEGAWGVSAVFSQLAIALLAGNIIACERADHSAAFLAYQGASRKMVVSSKLLICALTFILIWAIAIFLSFWLKIKAKEDQDFLLVLSTIVATGFCFFGGCWLLSALLSSSVAAIVFGLLPPFFIIAALGFINYHLKLPSDNAIPYWYIALNIATSLISLVAGTWYFLKSKES